MSDKIRELLNRIIPRLDAGGPNPIDPELHHCEWALYQERERIHAEFEAALAQQPATAAVPEPGLYAIQYHDNWDGDGDTYYLIAQRTDDGRWLRDENGRELLEYEGDAVLAAWPLTTGTTSDKCRAEVEALRKDAERYHKLRSVWPPQFTQIFEACHQGDVARERYARMDEMVDAMAAKEGV